MIFNSKILVVGILLASVLLYSTLVTSTIDGIYVGHASKPMKVFSHYLIEGDKKTPIYVMEDVASQQQFIFSMFLTFLLLTCIMTPVCYLIYRR